MRTVCFGQRRGYIQQIGTSCLGTHFVLTHLIKHMLWLYHRQCIKHALFPYTPHGHCFTGSCGSSSSCLTCEVCFSGGCGIPSSPCGIPSLASPFLH